MKMHNAFYIPDREFVPIQNLVCPISDLRQCLDCTLKVFGSQIGEGGELIFAPFYAT